MSRLLKITDLGSGIMVQGTDNVLFPDNATLTYPYNSIVVVTDESDIATFRSASNNDVLFSGIIGSIQIGSDTVTKQNINTKFDAIANQESGGGGDVTGLFADASYDSQTKHINFYDKHNTLVAYVDATDFIKDGMVSNVEILNGNLVITFNTDAGKEPITIPLTDIFNPSNYYDKTTADNTFATQVVVNEEIAARIAGDGALNTALGTKADKSDTYTKAQVDDALALKQDTISDLSTIRSGAALGATAYQKPNDGIPASDLANGVIPTVPTNVSAFTNDAGYLTQHQSLDNYYTKTQTDAAIQTAVGQIDLSDYQTKADADVKEEVVSTALVTLNTSKQDKLTAGANITIDANNVISATVPDTSDFVTKAEYNPKEVAIAHALTDLNENKADKTDIPNLNNYYTKNETDTAISTAIGQIDLSDYQTKADADVKEEVVSTALVTLDTEKADKSEIPTLTSDLTNDSNFVEGGGDIVSIVKISQSAYNSLVSPDPYTLYIITSNV